MNIRELKIHELKPYEKNPRNNDNAVEAVAASIEEFGFKVPIVIDKDGVIIAGHTRFKAAQKLGLTTVPCVIADDLTPEQAKAFRVADNKTAELAEWDMELLKQELEELAQIEFNMEQFGFEPFEEQKEIIEDEAPEVDEENEPTTKRGEIWRLGKHYLMCGDSTSAADVEKLMNGNKADLLLTDPPYNVEYTGKTADALTIQNDSMTDAQFIKFLEKAFSAASQSMRAGAAFYIWHAIIKSKEFFQACENVQWKVRQVLIWNKSIFTIGRQDYQWKHEPCIYGWKEGAAHYFIDSRVETTVIEDNPNINKMSKNELKALVKELMKNAPASTVIYDDKPSRSEEHPTMKPIKLFAYQIRNSSKKGEIVLDVFGGSGTSVIACEQTGRICYTMELDPHYCDVIIKRWENLTGKKAERIGQK